MLLDIVGFIIALFIVGAVVGAVVDRILRKKLKSARAEYEQIEKEYGYNAREHCPHRLVEFGQTGVPGVVTMTTKWCKVCGKYLGSAKLKKSIESLGVSWFVHLPLVDELLDHVLGREVEIDLRRRQVIVAEEPLKRRQRYPLLNSGHAEGVAEHMGAHLPADACTRFAIRPYDALKCPHAHPQRVVEREVSLK
jgi:hypothetical protein